MSGSSGKQGINNCKCTGNTTQTYDFNVEPANGLDANGLYYRPNWSWQQLPGNQGQIPNPATCHYFSVRGGPDPGLAASGGTLAGILGDAVLGPWGAILGLVGGSSLGSVALMDPSFADCTDQPHPYDVDLPVDFDKQVCETNEIADGLVHGFTSFSGHLNWFPVTLEGTAGCCDQGEDSDYTFSFNSDIPDDVSLHLTTYGGFHVEFDSQETIDHFAQSKDWWDLRSAVSANHTAAETKYQGHVIATGMFGLDGEHDLKPELHPLYAMALRPEAKPLHGAIGDPLASSEDMWLMFVRNQGNEGYCSSEIWDGVFEDYTFQLPWKPNMTHVEVNWQPGKTSFWGTAGTTGPSVTVVPSTRVGEPGDLAVNVRFHIGPAAKPAKDVDSSDVSVPIIFGALYLDWSVSNAPPSTAGSPGNVKTVPGHSVSEPAVVKSVPGQPVSKPAASHAAAQVVAKQEAKPSTEEEDVSLATNIRKLTAAQRERMNKALVLSPPRTVTFSQLPSTGPVQVLKEVPAELRHAEPVQIHAINGGPATRKKARDAAQLRALCVATDNAPPGLPPSVCKLAEAAKP